MRFHHKNAGFTLIEVLVSAGIVVVLMVVLLGMTDQTQRMVRSTSAKVEQFQEARVAFESMTRHLSQATLNTFWDYDNPTKPTKYIRAAELRFRSDSMKNLTGGTGPNGNPQPSHGVFFQAPLGVVDPMINPSLRPLDHLINTWGYFVEIGSDADKLPTFLKNTVEPRKRYRLMELMQPSEQLGIYTPSSQVPTISTWFALSVKAATNRPVRVLAENIVALIVLPRLSVADEELWKKLTKSKTAPILAPNYQYDSSNPANKQNSDPLLNTLNQIPPVVQVVMVAIDEPSAQRLEDRFGSDPYLGINYAPDQLSSSTLFADPASLDDSTSGKKGDLTKIQESLVSKKLSYRIFSTNVSIRGAKWSRSQVN